MRAIARRAGVSPTALYLQFPDRDALVDAAVDAGFAAFNAELIDAASGPAPAARAARGDGRRLPGVRQSAGRRSTRSCSPPAGATARDSPGSRASARFEGLVALLQ